MTITISLSPKAEARLEQQAAAKGRNVSVYAAELIEQAVAGQDIVATPVEPSPEQRAVLWRGWVQSHAPVNHVVDDSRESIYAGRGE